MPILLAIILKALQLVKQAAVAAVKPKRSVTHAEKRLKIYLLQGYRIIKGIPGCMDDGWEYDDEGKEMKGDDAFAVLIWYSAVAKPSVSHVRRLKLGSKLFLAMSQIYGSARLIVARLGQRAIFSRATATLHVATDLGAESQKLRPELNSRAPTLLDGSSVHVTVRVVGLGA